MTIKLRDEWLAKIRPAMIDGLKEVSVNNGMFIDRTSTRALLISDFLLPKKSPVRAELEAFVDEFPLVEFATDTLSRELYDLDNWQSEPPSIPLIKIDGYQDVEALADRLLDEVQTLPWSYLVTLKLPERLWPYAPDEDFQVSDDIWLRRGGKTMEQIAPLENLPEDASRRLRGRGLLGLMIGEGPKWEDGAVYVQMTVQGFIPPYGDSESFRIAISRLKSFFGLWIAMRVVDLQSRSLGATPKVEALVHRQYPGGYKADNRLDLEDSFGMVLDRMHAFSSNGTMKDEAVLKKWFIDDLDKLCIVFRNEPQAKNLLLAGQWVFDSRSDSDPLLSYIRSMIVLEIVLGSQKDGSELGVGDLIRNRCAYLIGNDFEERQRLLDDLKTIYAVRSQIVHRGKAKLTLGERTMLSRLQHIGNRVIQAEVARVPHLKASA